MAAQINIDIPPELSKAVTKFLQKLLGPAAEASEFLSDKIRFHRWKAALRIVDRAREILEKRGLQPQEVPLKFLVPFLDNCSLEEDTSDLQNAWANLLVKASSDFEDRLNAYIDILSRLGPKDVQILKSLHENYDPALFDSYRHFAETIMHGHRNTPERVLASTKTGARHLMSGTSVGGHIDSWAASQMNEIISLQILDRENLISLKSDIDASHDGMVSFEIWIQLTPMGCDFVNVCCGLKGR